MLGSNSIFPPKLSRILICDDGSFQTNEVTTDYNAGFQSAVAGLAQAFL